MSCEIPYEEALAFATEFFVIDTFLTCEALLMSSNNERVCSVVVCVLVFCFAKPAPILVEL